MSKLILTHGCSLSNLPLFVAVGQGYFAAEGLDVEAPYFDDIGSTSELLASGTADLGTVGYIQPLIDANRDDPPVMVAGSGLMGVALLAQTDIRTTAELRGQVVATFRGDPMEVLLHDALTAAGLGMDDIDVRYFDVLDEAVQAWRSGTVAAVTLAEPAADRLRREGARTLTDGRDVWGDGFPDTVLVASSKFLRERPDDVRAAIRAMLRAEAGIHADPIGALEHARPFYPEFEFDELIAASVRQPPRIDITHLVPTILDRWPSLRSLGLVPSDAPLPNSALNFDLLESELAAPRPTSYASQ
jgi:ABC-type nitrate/sulfonate/bicarbonate transport system substrate-binding protein